MEPLPKPVKQALENLGQSGGPHPDADLLAAFQEGAVTARERERLLVHFAACAHCREVARLSLPAPESKQQVVVPAASGWRPRLSWAAVAVSAVVLGSVGVIYQAQHHGAEQAKLLATRSDTSAPAVAPGTAVEPATPAHQPRKAAKTASPSDKAKVAAKSLGPAAATPAIDLQTAPLRQKATAGLEAKPANVFSSAEPGVKVPDLLAGGSQADAHSGASGDIGSRTPAEPSATGGYQNDSQAARSQAMKAMGAATEAQRKTASLAPHSPSALDSVGPARAQWRISPAGELQRAFAGSDWQTVLGSAHTRFHALAVVGQNVWAGGSEANLFHSVDGGASWTRVALPTNGPAAPTITRITFDDALRGTVDADNATTWATADGGLTWSKR
jgi:photosystem II stability/assembly factor-like uncharacterized protein